MQSKKKNTETKKENVVKVKLDKGAILPEQAHSQDVGFDIKAISCEYSEEYDMYIYHTGIYVETNSDNSDFVNSIYLFPRSSNSKKECYLTNSVGIVDSDIYRGEIQARFKNRTSLESMINDEVSKRMISDIVSGGFVIPYNEMYTNVKDAYTKMAKNLKFAPYNVGDAVAQLVFAKEVKPKFIEVDKLNENTDRGTGGFGSTGK